MKFFKYFLPLIFIIFLISLGIFLLFPKSSSDSKFSELAEIKSSSVVSTTFSFSQKPQEVINFSVSPTFIYPALRKYPVPQFSSSSTKIKGVIVPHHDLASDLTAEALQKVVKVQKPKRIILIGPNHPDAGGADILTSQAIWQTDQWQISPDTGMVQKLTGRAGVRFDSDILSHEHSIFTILPFIHTYFPEAKIVPLILKSTALLPEITVLSEEVKKYSDADTLIIASIDFSHYLPSDEAVKKDRVTRGLILNRNYEEIIKLNNDYVDSPPSLATILKIMDLSEAKTAEILRNTNSGEILHRPVFSSTSYFTIIFSL